MTTDFMTYADDSVGTRGLESPTVILMITSVDKLEFVGQLD